MKKWIKKYEIYALCLFLFIVFLILVAWCFVVSTRAQEGCGEWVELDRVGRAGQEPYCKEYWLYKFYHPSDKLDSVWVEKPCPSSIPVVVGLSDTLDTKSRYNAEFIKDVWNPDIDVSTLGVKYFLKWMDCMEAKAKVETVYVFKPCPDTSSGDWYYELKLEYYPTIWIRLDTMWQAGDIVWRKR